MYEGEILLNTNVLNSSLKSKLFYCGSLNSILPLLEFGQTIAKSTEISSMSLCHTVNEFLTLVNSIISTKAYSSYESETSNFFTVLFLLLTKLPKSSVNNTTI